MFENICNFIPYNKDYHSMHTINFVLETKEQKFSGLSSQSTYKVHYVCNGRGNLHLPGKIIPLCAGDIFFTFPAMPFCIESVEDFSYMYITFLGARANMIMEKLKISNQEFLFHSCEDVYELWKSGISIATELSDIMTESILLYTFSFLGKRLLVTEESSVSQENTSLYIKKYIDDCFSNPKMSLEAIANELSYSPKYISSVFKRRFNIGVVEYLNTLRIQHACTLMNQGFTSISDIAAQCGYSDSQYFSKIFKKKLNLTPREYIKNIENEKNLSNR